MPLSKNRPTSAPEPEEPSGIISNPALDGSDAEDRLPVIRRATLEDEGLAPVFEDKGFERKYEQDNTPLNLQGYVERGRLTADDLLTKKYDDEYARLQPQVLEVKEWLQNVLQQEKMSDDIVEARRARGEKYTQMRKEIDKLLVRHFTTGANVRRQDIPVVSAMVTNEILGLSMLEPLWFDSRITEIMVNGPKRTYVEIAGRPGVQLVPGVQFRDDKHLLEVANQIFAPLNKTLDPVHPLMDGRLSDGSRINATHTVVGPGGPYLTIRRFPDTIFTMRELVERASMTEEMAVEIGNLVHNGCSVVVIGSTGSGKTSFLNALSGCVPREERIITIEDNLELQLHPEAHVVAMEARQSRNSEEDHGITPRDLVRNSLRQRPTRIIVGESRDFTAYDMLQAMNTGHDGSMTTVHANDASGGIDRLINLMAESGEIDDRRGLSLIAGGVDLMVVIERFPEDNSRRVVSVEEVPSRLSFTEGNPDLQPVPLWSFIQDATEPTEDGGERVIGHYEKTGDLSTSLIRKRRLDRKRRLSLDEIYAMSDLTPIVEKKEG